MKPEEHPIKPPVPRLRTMSDEGLWWIFLHHRQECGQEFWREIENRKAAGILSKASPFWIITQSSGYRRESMPEDSNVIELNREEWEARRRRKKFRLIS